MRGRGRQQFAPHAVQARLEEKDAHSNPEQILEKIFQPPAAEAAHRAKLGQENSPVTVLADKLPHPVQPLVAPGHSRIQGRPALALIVAEQIEEMFVQLIFQSSKR